MLQLGQQIPIKSLIKKIIIDYLEPVRNRAMFSDRRTVMPTIAERILEHAQALPEGALLSAKEFLHLGKRAAVDQSLKRLAERKELWRLYQGVYVRPVMTKFGTRAPAPEKVIESLKRAQAETVVPHGAAEANALGLTTQVPTKLVYLTSGKNRTLKLGLQTIEMKHAPQWLLIVSHGEVGKAVRALDWLGKGRTNEALESLKRRLPPAEVRELVAIRQALPAWMAKSISETLVLNG
jgi:hypothetical protein